MAGACQSGGNPCGSLSGVMGHASLVGVRCLRILLALTMVGLVGLVPLRGAAAATGGWQWPTSPTMSQDAGTMACADLLFIGVRGSGEAAPYGDTVSMVRDQYRQRISTPSEGVATVREVAISYPATSPHTLAEIGPEQLLFAETLPDTDYFTSAAIGISNLSAVLDDSQRRCPNERWVLAGFSQGSQVITGALDRRTGADNSQLVSATLLGNPSHYPGQLLRSEAGDAPTFGAGLVTSLFYVREAGRVGRTSNDLRGVQATVAALLRLSQGDVDEELMSTTARTNGLRIPSTASDRVASVCAAEDLICNAGPGLGRVALGLSTLQEEIDRARPAHLGYTSEQVDLVNASAYAELLALLPELEQEAPEETQGPLPDVLTEPGSSAVLGVVGVGFTLLVVAAGGISLRRRELRRRAAEAELEAGDDEHERAGQTSGTWNTPAQ